MAGAWRARLCLTRHAIQDRTSIAIDGMLVNTCTYYCDGLVLVVGPWPWTFKSIYCLLDLKARIATVDMAQVVLQLVECSLVNSLIYYKLRPLRLACSTPSDVARA